MARCELLEYPMFPDKRSGFTLVELMVVIGILALLVGILAVAVFPQITKARADTEKIAMGKLVMGLQQAAVSDPGSLAPLGQKENANKAGREFYALCFREGILERDLLAKVVSLNGSDEEAQSAVIVDDGEEMEARNCSYTSPRAGELREVMRLVGRKKVVLITFDSRNWNNYTGINRGALCAWSEGSVTDYMKWDEASSEWSITEAEWETPGDSLFGKKAPFHRTHEE
ncbi:MAG: type II secretion system GspH family protein [Gemmatimonadota bacterium]|nr:type II secretion system GspH family protein [Gemmatimonadota bacterium]